PAPVPVAAREAYLRQHAGQTNQPYNHAAMRQAVAPTVRTAPVAAVRTVQPPAAKPVAVRPGQRGGNVATLPGARPGQPASAARPGQPATETRQPAPAGHGAPPNMRQATPANGSRPG